MYMYMEDVPKQFMHNTGFNLRFLHCVYNYLFGGGGGGGREGDTWSFFYNFSTIPMQVPRNEGKGASAGLPPPF